MEVYSHKSIIITEKKEEGKKTSRHLLSLQGPAESSLPGNESTLLNQDSPDPRADPSGTTPASVCHLLSS